MSPPRTPSRGLRLRGKLGRAVSHKIRVVPVRVRWYEDKLLVDATRVVGYRAVCSCGFRSVVLKSVQAARASGREHRARVGRAPDG